MPAPRLSVIVTTHHRPALLPRALASVIALGAEVQIVLCADESSQATREIAAKYLRDHDIFLAAPGLRGPSETRNLGLRLATGDYITFLDDDDTMEQGVVGLLPELDGRHVVYTDYRRILETEVGQERVEKSRVDRKTTVRPISALMVKNFIIVSAYFAPRTVANTLEFRSDLSSSEDWEFLIQLYESAPFRHVAMISSNWHISESGVSRNKADRTVRIQNCKKIYELHPSKDERTRQKRIARLRYMGATETDDVR